MVPRNWTEVRLAGTHFRKVGNNTHYLIINVLEGSSGAIFCRKGDLWEYARGANCLDLVNTHTHTHSHTDFEQLQCIMISSVPAGLKICMAQNDLLRADGMIGIFMPGSLPQF